MLTHSYSTAALATVLLADACPYYHLGFAAALQPGAGFQLAGRAADAGALLVQVAHHSPSVVIVHEGLAFAGGLLPQLADRWPGVNVVLLMDSAQLATMVRGRKAGVSGFISRQAPPPEMLRTLRTVHEGNMGFCSQCQPFRRRLMAANPVDLELTADEKDLLALISRGLKITEIATALPLGKEGTKKRIQKLAHKVGRRGKLELWKYAVENGLARGADDDE